MKLHRFFAVFLFLIAGVFTQNAFSAGGGGGGVGINAGFGLPYVSQYGVDIAFSDKFGLALGYNNLSLTVGVTGVTLTMPELLLTWRPFSGAFFIGVGAGQEDMKATATDATTSQTAEIAVKASTSIAKLGWMWGRGDKGLWFGMDVSYISPSGATTTITTALPATDPAYQDAQTQAEKFGSTAYTNITFARLGYMF